LWVLTQINNGVHYQLFESPTAAGQNQQISVKGSQQPFAPTIVKLCRVL